MRSTLKFRFLFRRKPAMISFNPRSGFIGQMIAGGIIIVGAVAIASNALLTNTTRARDTSRHAQTVMMINNNVQKLISLPGEAESKDIGLVKVKVPFATDLDEYDDCLDGVGYKLPSNQRLYNNDAWGRPFCYIPFGKFGDSDGTLGVKHNISDFNNLEVNFTNVSDLSNKLYPLTAFVVLSAGKDGKFNTNIDDFKASGASDPEDYIKIAKFKSKTDDIVRLVTFGELNNLNVSNRKEGIAQKLADDMNPQNILGGVNTPRSGCQDDNAIMSFDGTHWSCSFIDTAFLPREASSCEAIYDYSNRALKLKQENNFTVLSNGLIKSYCSKIPADPSPFGEFGLAHGFWKGDGFEIKRNALEAKFMSKDSCQPGQFLVFEADGFSKCVDAVSDKGAAECTRLSLTGSGNIDFASNSTFNFNGQITNSNINQIVKKVTDYNANTISKSGLIGFQAEPGWILTSCSKMSESTVEEDTYNVENACLTDAMQNNDILTASICKTAIPTPPICGNTSELVWTLNSRWKCKPFIAPGSPSASVFTCPADTYKANEEYSTGSEAENCWYYCNERSSFVKNSNLCAQANKLNRDDECVLDDNDPLTADEASCP